MMQEVLSAIGLLFLSYNLGLIAQNAKHYLVHKKFPMKEKDILIQSLQEQNISLKEEVKSKKKELEKLQNLITESLL